MTLLEATFVALADLHLQPGRRLELEEAARQANALLREQPGCLGARLLHFSGGPYLYRYEIDWRSREDWQRFWESPAYPALRATLDPWTAQPFVVQLHDVKVSG
ncbi:MAG: hypothetical protein KatS3mg061_1979 [Dehalococcoidia bacterium]|nr:MAG: hypothetical protein KatS3mg061_1979 [Dehalococcoidia bacterium]